MQTLFVVGLVLLIVVALAGIAIGALRYRKLRRDDLRAAERRRHATALPPSPYQPSGAVHILEDGEEPSPQRYEPELARLDPGHANYFSDWSGPDNTLVPASSARRNDQWALERSFHRSRISPVSLRALFIASVALVALIVVGAIIQATAKHEGTTTTTTTTPATSTSTTVASLGAPWPSQLIDYSLAGGTALYHVPSATYRVAVSSPLGNDWIVISMGVHQVLEYQGDVMRTSTYQLQLTGEGWVSLGSPHSARVTVNGHLVVFPARLSSPFTLDFKPPGT